MGNYAVEECVYCGAENQAILKKSDAEVCYVCPCGAETTISLQETDNVNG